MNTLNKEKIATLGPDARRKLGKLRDIPASTSDYALANKLATLDGPVIDAFVREEFSQSVERRRRIIGDNELRQELEKLRFLPRWHGRQGESGRKWKVSDNDINNRFVRPFPEHSRMIKEIELRLATNGYLRQITEQATNIWFNHWSTELLERRAYTHPRVIPALEHVRGIDFFLEDSPFDLKITHFPLTCGMNVNGYDPKQLQKWLYENQGGARGDTSNRFFLIVIDAGNRAQSWKIKRTEYIASRLWDIFDEVAVVPDDSLVFHYRGSKHRAVSKLYEIRKPPLVQ